MNITCNILLQEKREYMYAAKSLQSCLTLCDPIDGSPRGSPVPGILQTRTLEWVAISFSNAWKWKVKMKSLSRVRLLATPWTTAHQALCPWDFPGKSTGVGCHCLLQYIYIYVCVCVYVHIHAYMYIHMCICVYTYMCLYERNTWYFVMRKKGNTDICDNLHEPWGHYTRWNK